ncbi:hypothetical protein, partial [Anaerosporobacter sp.]
MIIIAVLLSKKAIVDEDNVIGFIILILVPTLYLKWFLQNWKTSNRSICQYYDIDPQQLKLMIEKETFYDCVKEKIPSRLYQESQNYHMICGRFIAKKSVLSVNYVTTGGAGGRGASSNYYIFILCNGKRVSLNTRF